MELGLALIGERFGGRLGDGLVINLSPTSTELQIGLHSSEITYLVTPKAKDFRGLHLARRGNSIKT